MASASREDWPPVVGQAQGTAMKKKKEPEILLVVRDPGWSVNPDKVRTVKP
jgi:hypothetical protein